MKKIFFLLAIAALAATGCRTDDNDMHSSHDQSPGVSGGMTAPPPAGGGTSQTSTGTP